MKSNHYEYKAYTYEIINNNAVINNIDCINIMHTFECGQCFRWEKIEENNYIGVAHNSVIRVEMKNENKMTLYNTGKLDLENIWLDYFDLKHNYNEIVTRFPKNDKQLALAVSYGKGLRLLKQELFETMISFVISQNNNIPRIKKIIEYLCKSYGESIAYENNIFYSFPKAEILAGLDKKEVLKSGSGYRSQYIIEASRAFDNDTISRSELENIPIIEARKKLLTIKGIGPKVADCILLFSGINKKAFPIDTWVKKAMKYLYNKEYKNYDAMISFANGYFGEHSGLAQQYLFYYMRNKKDLDIRSR